MANEHMYLMCAHAYILSIQAANKCKDTSNSDKNLHNTEHQWRGTLSLGKRCVFLGILALAQSCPLRFEYSSR